MNSFGVNMHRLYALKARLDFFQSITNQSLVVQDFKRTELLHKTLCGLMTFNFMMTVRQFCARFFQSDSF